MGDIKTADSDGDSLLFDKSMKLVLITVLFLSASIFINSRNYELFKLGTDLFTITIAFCVLIISYYSYQISKNNVFMFLGIAYGFSGLFHLLHVFTYKGLDIFSDDLENLGMQFIVLAKLIESLSLMIAAVFYIKLSRGIIKPFYIFCSFSIISAILLVSILVYRAFPACVVDGSLPTGFKLACGYVIIAALVAALAVIVTGGRNIYNDIFLFMIFAIGMKLLSETFFLLHAGKFEFLSILGHVFRLISFFYIYKAIVESSLKTPYKVLFLELNRAHDNLKEKTVELQEVNDRLLGENAERKNAEEELRKSEERYRQLFELAPYGIAILFQGIIVLANKKFARLCGANAPEDVIGKRGDSFVMTHPDYSDIVEERTRRLFEYGETQPPLERKIIRSDGEEMYLEIATAPYPYKNGLAKLQILKDVTENKKIEEIKRSMEENKKLLYEQIELDKFRTEFFANLSHELRTPLNVILGVIQLQESYVGKGTELDIENIARHSKVMKQNCLRLLRLVNNIIDITRIEAGFYELKLKNQNIVKVVEDITQSVAGFVKDKGLNLIFDTEFEEEIVAFDADKIERIMLNLLSNAIKFTGPGGNITVYLYKEGESIFISVKDTGCGIPEDKLEIIFERFRQIDKSLARNHEGSGIGLSLVKSFVEMHEGEILVHSELGQGSEFLIRLPSKTVCEELPNNEYDISSLQKHIERINIEFSDIYMDS